MKAKHTPGPWAVHPITARVDAFDSGSPLPVCQMLWPTEVRSEHETEANAHLIAAAPDLLVALKTLTNAINAAGIPEWLSVVDFIDALGAVQKAEGREGEPVRL